MKETRFKDTEVGRIPEDWEVINVGKNFFLKGRIGWQGLKASEFKQQGPFLVTGTDFFNGKIDWKKCYHITIQRYLQDQKLQVKSGDVLITKDGTIGKLAYIDNVPGLVSLNSHLLIIRPFDTNIIDNHYIFYHLKGRDFSDYVDVAQTGTTMASLTQEKVAKYNLPLPPLEEQSRIASALTSIDNLISSIDILIEKKRAIKQGAMQQLLTGKKRLKGFSEPWVEKKLGEILQYEQPTKYLVSSTDYSDNGVPVLTAGKTFILGYTNDPNGIYNNLPVIIFDDFVTESKYVDFPFKAKSSAMKMLTLRNEENNLRFVFEIMQMIDFPMTDHKRWWIGEYSNIIVKVPLLDEQNAIASILISMDNEISALEAKKAKFEQIKQGMMQQLLTGKIRLEETAVKTNVTSANVHFRRSVLAAEIAERLYEEPTFGHVKMEKMLFLTERLCHIDIGSHYHRDAAGPYDNRALRSIDSQLKKQKWFEVRRTEKGNRYVPMQNRGKHKAYFDKYYSTVLPTFDKIIDTFKTQNTERCEIVATLYSAWEDLLHSNKPFTDADTVNEVLNNWHESKKRISKERWLSAIQWMRENGFAPKV